MPASRAGAFERSPVLRTLVLNAGYEPLAVVSFKRAIVLVLGGGVFWRDANWFVRVGI